MSVLLGTPLSASAPADGPPSSSQITATRDLAHRLLGAKPDQFAFEAIPADTGRDVFEIESAGGKIVIRGNTGVAAGLGLNWYLREQAEALAAGRVLDEQDFHRRLLAWETKWSDQQETYPAKPAGDSLALARRLREKYAP